MLKPAIANLTLRLNVSLDLEFDDPQEALRRLEAFRDATMEALPTEQQVDIIHQIAQAKRSIEAARQL